MALHKHETKKNMSYRRHELEAMNFRTQVTKEDRVVSFTSRRTVK